MSVEVQILACQGVFDPVAAMKTLDGVIAGGGLRLILNMKALTFITSAGLGGLLHSQKRLRERGGEVVISHPQPHLTRTLDTLGLEEIFKVFGTDEEALTYFGGTEGAAGVTARVIPVKPRGSA
jgi:anti-sigma B factor antagonist